MQEPEHRWWRGPHPRRSLPGHLEDRARGTLSDSRRACEGPWGLIAGISRRKKTRVCRPRGRGHSAVAVGRSAPNRDSRPGPLPLPDPSCSSLDRHRRAGQPRGARRAVVMAEQDGASAAPVPGDNGPAVGRGEPRPLPPGSLTSAPQDRTTQTRPEAEGRAGRKRRDAGPTGLPGRRCVPAGFPCLTHTGPRAPRLTVVPVPGNWGRVEGAEPGCQRGGAPRTLPSPSPASPRPLSAPLPTGTPLGTCWFPWAWLVLLGPGWPLPRFWSLAGSRGALPDRRPGSHGERASAPQLLHRGTG